MNGYQNGYQSEPFSDEEEDVELPSGYQELNGYHGNHGEKNSDLIRETVAQTEEHCKRMFEEMKKLRKQLRSVSGNTSELFRF